MSHTQVLLTKISALRQQLDQVQGLAKDAGSAAASLLQAAPPTTAQLERTVAAADQENRLIHDAIRQLSAQAASEADIFPKQLTARARRLLEQGKDLLQRLRALADTLEGLALDWADPLAERYDQTVAMTETALRTIQAFPDAASAQLRLSEGVEAILSVVDERIASMTEALDARRTESERTLMLAGLLTALQANQPVVLDSFVSLAEALLAEARQGTPLRFLSSAVHRPAEFIASHSLTVAQVVARLVSHATEFQAAPLEPVLAALLHDVGMLAVPSVILAQPGPLDDSQRRIIEEHTRTGAKLTARLGSTGARLSEAVANHHERLDGTGYPAGLREAQLTQLSRLLAVCDVYAALCAPRQQRPALDTRTALADTLMLAEQGSLDRYHAERLLQLSFYPVGTVVELADGAVGVVVAAQAGRQDVQAPARPVVALLTDSRGSPLPFLHHVDLSQCEGKSIVRCLPANERREILGARYPQFAA